MKDVKGQEGRYAVTEDGRVWSYLSSKFLKPGKSGQGGYPSVALIVDGKPRTSYIHRMVATAFIPNADNKPVVNHKNGIKTDNRIGNLEWVTTRENVHHAINTGLFKTEGEDNACSKLTEAQVTEIRQRYVTDYAATQESLAAEFGVHRVLVKKIVAGEIWQHIWKPEFARPHNWKRVGVGGLNRNFTPEVTSEIRRKYELGGHTLRSLAVEYGMSSSTVGRVVQGLTLPRQRREIKA